MSEWMATIVGRILTFELSDLRREDGQGAVEYGIILAFVAVTIGALLLTVLKPQISAFFTKVGSDISAAV